MNTNALSTQTKKNSSASIFAIPLLNRIRKEGREEYREMNQAFELMGWGELPDALKIEIHEDVKFMVQELKGYYSSCDPYVQRRRNSIHFWVSSYQDGVCTLDAAIKALKVKAL